MPDLDIVERRIPTHWRPAGLRPLADMVSQAHRLQAAVSAPSTWTELAIESPEIAEVVGAVPDQGMDATRERLVELYRRYCQEWDTFPARPPGWARAA